MEKETQNNGKKGTGCIIAVFIIFLIVFLPISCIMVSSNIESSKEIEHEMKLKEEGKTKTARDVISEIIDIIVNREEQKLNSYLSEDFLYYHNSNTGLSNLNSFWWALDECVSSYEVDERENSIEDKATYRIYWNVVEENKKNGIDKDSEYYCLQKITIILKRIVKEDIITYDIEKIILTDN